ncbi:MAG TPA: hypothetical protein ENG42_02175 [Candidatus Aenigmarchaeota archaeon]|nr:MAG: hypothetical protein DRP03_02290 [Candidatus Aenigmarchaeota archaeon]HDD46255.1 hypothetical protein [Candidatus Aenigmarchaeota archaeon]
MDYIKVIEKLKSEIKEIGNELSLVELAIKQKYGSVPIRDHLFRYCISLIETPCADLRAIVKESDQELQEDMLLVMGYYEKRLKRIGRELRKNIFTYTIDLIEVEATLAETLGIEHEESYKERILSNEHIKMLAEYEIRRLN